MKFKAVFIGCAALSTMLCGQTRFALPLKEKVFLTGNYGEIRPNHFHAGLDFRTDIKKNLPIYAVADGYVSRIKVGTHGYGKVLYITHPGGLVSVYGHQYSFNADIKKYVRAAQDMMETFEVELFPKKDELKVKQGDIIGYTGNTGDSEGPHLHFEIRDEKSEVPLNPLRFVDIVDTVAPQITSLAVYDEDFTTPQLFKIKKKKTDTVSVDMKVGFGVECFDLEQKAGNKNNIYAIELSSDGITYQRIVLDSVPFDMARYVNAYCDQDLRRAKGIKMQKTFMGKNNDLRIYKNGHTGFLYLEDTLYHTIGFKVYDYFNQSAGAKLVVKRKPATRMKPVIIPPVDCLKPWKKTEKEYSIEIPEKSLYKDVFMRDSISKGTLFFYAAGYNVPLHKSCLIGIKPGSEMLNYAGKLCLTDAAGSYYGGNIIEGYVSATTKNFGTFKIAMDTSAPQLKFVKPKSKKPKIYKNGDTINFKVSDDLSGIDKFKLFLNDKFYYTEYEHKTGLIFFEVTDKTPKGKIEVRLEVSDKKNNKATISQTLTFE